MQIKLGKVREHRLIQPFNQQGIIDGVVIKALKTIPDDRGYFAEIFRTTEPIANGFELKQSSITMTRMGVIKAFHYHEKQTDIFLPISGTAKITLIDARTDSDTYLHANMIIAGEYYLRAVRIPPGVLHGYEVLPDKHMTMVYYTNQSYDVTDEHRVPYDSPVLAFAGWGIENR